VSALTRLLLIRHGETEGAAASRFYGRSDVPLSSPGERQMEALGRKLVDRPLAAVYASDLRRSIRSAEILGRSHSLEPTVEPAFREIDMGRWEGLTWDEIHARDPKYAAHWLDGPGATPFPDGESLADFRARVIPALERILGAHREQTIALVGHGGTNRLILCEAIGAPSARFFAIAQDFSALNILDWYAGGSVLLMMNDTCHVGAPPRARNGG